MVDLFFLDESIEIMQVVFFQMQPTEGSRIKAISLLLAEKEKIQTRKYLLSSNTEEILRVKVFVLRQYKTISQNYYGK